MSKGRLLPKDFGDRLRKARMMRGLSQNKLAKVAGISHSLISRYEAGIRQPTLRTFRMMCVRMHVSADYLLGLSIEYKGETEDG